jgi:outer membrane receptor protein involved in Fe transport
MRPTQSYNVAAGNTFGRLGVIGAVTFTSAPQRYREIQNYLTIVGPNQPGLFTQYPSYQADNEGTRLGAVLNAAVKLNDLNKIVFRNTMTHESDKESRSFEGYNGGIDNFIQVQRLRWVERSLYSSGIEGDHVAPKLGNSIFNWQFTYSRSGRDEPDLRETVRGRTENGTYNFLPLPESGFRFFNNLDDTIYEPQGAWAKPFYKGAFTGILKLGTRITLRDRNFNARRFRFAPVRTSTLDFSQPTEVVLGPDNIRPDGMVLREITRGTDTYTGDMDVYAGFAQLDLSLGPRWRIVGGARIEDANISVTTIDPLVPGAKPAEAKLVNRDVLPGINVIYAMTQRQNLRFGYGRTVNRPDFRELSPFDFQNVLGGFDTAGNPNLRRALIDNFDARWEWFLGGDQLLAASFFFKKFDDPIEVTLQPTGGNLRQSFLNADAAKNYGLEVEFRRNLRFVNPRLRDFGLTTNFTFVDSNVEIPESQEAILTSRERPLLGQSRYIYNLTGDWARPQWRSSARFTLNYVSSRITDVGSFGLPDVVQQANTFLDFVYQYDILENGKWSLRFSAENLSDNLYRWKQDVFTIRQYQLGRTFTIGTSFSIY